MSVPGTDVEQFAVRQRAIQDGRHKLIVRSDGGEYSSTSTETRASVCLFRTATRLRYRSARRSALGLQACRRTSSSDGNHLEVDPETLRSLRALGYVK